MAENTPKDTGRTGFYERAVQWVTDQVKPYLHRTSERFVNKAIDTYARNNPRFARMIEFEVRRRGDGAGLTQDVAEPLVWIGIKTMVAIAIEVVMRPFKNKEKFNLKWIGHSAALGIMANQAVELFRVLPRYKAGLQGSLEMAKDRQHSIEETGIDPFSSQTREISKAAYAKPGADTDFAQHVQSRSIAPAAILESRNGVAEPARAQ